MRQGVIPGSHSMMPVYRRIVKFRDITRREDAGDGSLQVFVDYHTAALVRLDRRTDQELRVQGDTQTHAEDIGLYLAPFLCFNVTGDAICRNNRFDLVAVNDMYAEFFRDVVHHFATFGIKADAQPEGAVDQPARVQRAHGEPIAAVLCN